MTIIVFPCPWSPRYWIAGDPITRETWAVRKDDWWTPLGIEFCGTIEDWLERFDHKGKPRPPLLTLDNEALYDEGL